MHHCAPFHAVAAYYSLQNNNARIDMIKGLRQYLHDKEEVAGINQIVKTPRIAPQLEIDTTTLLGIKMETVYI